jgi:hypothetical protein
MRARGPHGFVKATPFYCADCNVYYPSGRDLMEHVALEHDPNLGCGGPSHLTNMRMAVAKGLRRIVDES